MTSDVKKSLNTRYKIFFWLIQDTRYLFGINIHVRGTNLPIKSKKVLICEATHINAHAYTYFYATIEDFGGIT